MKRPIAIVLAVVAILALSWLGHRTWQLVGDLRQEIDTLAARVARLEGELADARKRADSAERRADEAAERANEATERAEQADGVAASMEARALAAESRAEIADRTAEAERNRAAEATTEADQARAAREEAELKWQDAARRAEDAEIEAWRARLEAEKLAEQRERDLDRLESALGKLAETRRTALGVVMNLGDSIEFDFDRAELRPEARELLSRIAGILMTADDFGVEVYGHTDDVGSDEYNQELSARRAAAVRGYLVDAGVDPQVIGMKGFGKSSPLVEGTDEAARQRNRRVEIAVVQITDDMPMAVVESTDGPSSDGR